jgi:hypothetical protein
MEITFNLVLAARAQNQTLAGKRTIFDADLIRSIHG